MRWSTNARDGALVGFVYAPSVLTDDCVPWLWSQVQQSDPAHLFALCEKVIHNCFLNASVAPRPPCPASVDEFHVGFERENILRGDIVQYPFSQ